MARLSKATLASGNVVALPTAAPRQVCNSRYADQRRASLAAWKAGAFADRYMHPHAREADKLAAEITGIKQTPELLVLSALLRVMDAETMNRVVEQLAPGVVGGSEVHRQALATVRVSRMNVGQHFDLMRAFERLNGEARS